MWVLNTGSASWNIALNSVSWDITWKCLHPIYLSLGWYLILECWTCNTECSNHDKDTRQRDNNKLRDIVCYLGAKSSTPKKPLRGPRTGDVPLVVVGPGQPFILSCWICSSICGYTGLIGVCNRTRTVIGVSTNLSKQISTRFPGDSRRDSKKNPGHVCLALASIGELKYP